MLLISDVRGEREREDLLQSFSFEATHPPNISVEDEEVHSYPVFSMLFNWINLQNPLLRICYYMNICVGLYQKRSPIEFNRGIIFLNSWSWNKLLNAIQCLMSESYKLLMYNYLSSENRMQTTSFHRLLPFRYHRIDEANEGLPLPSLQWIPYKH